MYVHVGACLVSGPLTYPVPFAADFVVEASCFEVGG